jgi:hypothetical protein
MRVGAIPFAAGDRDQEEGGVLLSLFESMETDGTLV